MFREKSFKLISVIIIIIGIIFGASLFPILGDSVQNFLQTIIPESMLAEFSDFQYSRIEIWQSGINLAVDNPFFGTGSGSFPEIFTNATGVFKGHPHNLFLELMVSYGIPGSILIITPITIISFLSFKKIFLDNDYKISNSIFEKSWIISLIILLVSQMVDVQYFDGRISLFLWILLAGSRNIIRKDVRLKI